MNSFSPLARETVAGGTAGFVATWFVHPLDTVRTRLQVAPIGLYSSAWDCAVKTVRGGGPKALYAGIFYPLCSQGLYKAIIFSANGFAVRSLDQWLPPNRQETRCRQGGACRITRSESLSSASPTSALKQAELSAKPQRQALWRTFICGGFAGGVNSLVVCPVELVRNRLMVQRYGGGQESGLKSSQGADLRRREGAGRERGKINARVRFGTSSAQPKVARAAVLGVEGGGGATAPVYKSSFACLKHAARTGGFLSLWRGLSATLARDVPGVGFWMVGFATSRDAILKHSPQTPSSAVSMASGCVAGVCFWIAALPFDTVKSVMQTTAQQSAKGVGIWACFGDIMKSRGPRGFYRGLDIALLRGVPSSAIVFLVRDWVLGLGRGRVAES